MSELIWKTATTKTKVLVSPRRRRQGKQRKYLKSTSWGPWVRAFLGYSCEVGSGSNSLATYRFSLTAMNKQEARCESLIEMTAAALTKHAVALMLGAVQKDNSGSSLDLALKRAVLQI